MKITSTFKKLLISKVAMQLNKNYERVHYIYWICILTSLLIYVGVSKFTPEPKFTEYLGNAAAGISIVLGVVAIFYSFISNNSLSSSLGNIASVSESLKLSESKIENILDQSKKLIGNHDANIASMRSISEHVTTSVLALSETLTEMSAKTDELQQTIHTVPIRLDSLKEMIEKDKQPIALNPQVGISHGFSAAQARSFNAKSSVAGNFLTYACTFANKNDREFNIRELLTLVKRNYPSLLAGYMNCMVAAGLLVRNDVDGKDDTWKISRIDAELAKDIGPYFYKWIDSAYKNDPESHAEYLEILKKIEKFYSASA